MRQTLLFLIAFFTLCTAQAQCVLTTGSYTEAQVEACLLACGCSTIIIPDGETVTLDGDWNLTDQGDLNIIVQGETGQLVFPGNGSSLVTLLVTENSSLTFENPDNPAPITGGNSNNDPRIVVGEDEFFTNDFDAIIASGGINPIITPIKLNFFRIVDTPEGFSKLEWQTLTETENKGFSLLKDGIEMAFIAGNGDSSAPINYEWIDSHYSTKQVNYQLVQYDFDGTVGFYSDIIQFEKDDFKFSVFPNPIISEFTVTSPIDGVEVSIYDLNGQLVRSQYGDFIHKFDLADLPAGIYVIRIQKDGKQLFIQKIIKR